ncbi:hypothetical protein MRBBS_1075 [Marinobacter sp. BSs20148]|nr:hypothetical protein MRBBS_1075 [Marinobacter sp. BSs20148]
MRSSRKRLRHSPEHRKSPRLLALALIASPRLDGSENAGFCHIAPQLTG